MRKMIPPATLKLDIDTSNTDMSFGPISMKTKSRIAATRMALLAYDLTVLPSSPFVIDINIGRLANGSRIMNSVTDIVRMPSGSIAIRIRVCIH